MRSIARWCVTHRRLALDAWLVALIGLAVLSKSAGSSYNDSFSLNGTQSFQALQLLEQKKPAGDFHARAAEMGAEALLHSLEDSASNVVRSMADSSRVGIRLVRFTHGWQRGVPFPRPELRHCECVLRRYRHGVGLPVR